MRPSIGKEMHNLQTIMRRRLKQSDLIVDGECRDISHANGRIISFLHDRDGQPTYQKDIEQEFGITRSTASRVLALMEYKGLLTRTGVSHDARLKRVELTDRARQCDDTMRKRGRELEEKVFAGFSDEELDLFMSFLTRIRDNAMNA